MIPVIQTASEPETVRRIIHSINYSEDIHPFTVVPGITTVTTAAPSITANVWAMAVDRSVFRTRMKDARWAVYAAGFCHPMDGNACQLSIQYVTNNFTLIPLGVPINVGIGPTKFFMGPVDVFGTAGVPQGERVPMIAFTAQKLSGADGVLVGVTLWIRFLARGQ